MEGKNYEFWVNEISARECSTLFLLSDDKSATPRESRFHSEKGNFLWIENLDFPTGGNVRKVTEDEISSFPRLQTEIVDKVFEASPGCWRYYAIPLQDE